MKTSEILFKAREIQLERGRAVNDYENEHSGVCMIGAIRLACGSVSPHGGNHLAIPAYFAMERVTGPLHLTLFSDRDCKTKHDMAAAFEIAACCAAAEGN